MRGPRRKTEGLDDSPTNRKPESYSADFSHELVNFLELRAMWRGEEAGL